MESYLIFNFHKMVLYKALVSAVLKIGEKQMNFLSLKTTVDPPKNTINTKCCWHLGHVAEKPMVVLGVIKKLSKTPFIYNLSLKDTCLLLSTSVLNEIISSSLVFKLCFKVYTS